MLLPFVQAYPMCCFTSLLKGVSADEIDSAELVRPTEKG